MKSILLVLALSASTFGQAPQPPKPQQTPAPTPFISASAYTGFQFRATALPGPSRPKKHVGPTVLFQ